MLPAPSSICIEGIDPGSKGAVAMLWPSVGVLGVWNLPVTKVEGSERTFTYVDGEALVDLLDRYQPSMAYLERVHAMPKDGAVGAFTFGDNFGSIKGCHARRVPLKMVSPNIWKANLGVSAVKATSVAKASTLFPQCVHLFGRPDKAEAALIALYGALANGHRITQPVRPHPESDRRRRKMS